MTNAAYMVQTDVGRGAQDGHLDSQSHTAPEL